MTGKQKMTKTKKQNIEGQGTLFETDPDCGGASGKKFRAEMMEAIHQIALTLHAIAELQVSSVKELRQLRGMTTTAREPKKTPEEKKRNLSALYTDMDRLILHGKKGALKKAVVILTARTAQTLRIQHGMRDGSITDALVVVPHAVSGVRATWEIDKSGVATFKSEKTFNRPMDHAWEIYPLDPKEGALVPGEILAYGETMPGAKPNTETNTEPTP